MNIWSSYKLKNNLNYSNIPHRAGLRLVFDSGINSKLKQYCNDFVEWLNYTYEFPIVIPIYIKNEFKLKCVDGGFAYGTFWEPYDCQDEAYIRIAVGDYEILCSKWGEDDATFSVFRTIAHELTHYFQWVKGLILTDTVREHQANVNSKTVIENYVKIWVKIKKRIEPNSFNNEHRFEGDKNMDIINIIEHCKNDRKVASLYFDKDDTSLHLTGYIVACNNFEVLIAHINARGEYDGYIFKYVDEIYRIDFDGEYENKVETLYKLKKQHHLNFELDNDNILQLLLQFAKNDGLLCTLETEDNSVVGFVKDFSQNSIELECVNDYGEHNGITGIDLEMIDSVYVDTDKEQDLKMLIPEKVESDNINL